MNQQIPPPQSQVVTSDDIDKFNKAWNRIFWLFAILPALALIGVQWIDNQYLLGRIEDWNNPWRWVCGLAIIAPIFQIFIQNRGARRLNRNYREIPGASTFSFIEAIIVMGLSGTIGMLAGPWAPDSEQARVARQISEHISVVRKEEKVIPPALVEARRWLSDRETTRQNWGKLQQLAEASSREADRKLMFLLQQSGVEGPEIDFFNDNRVVRTSDLKSLLDKMDTQPND